MADFRVHVSRTCEVSTSFGSQGTVDDDRSIGIPDLDRATFCSVNHD